MQFRYGATWQYVVAVGDALPWGRNDVGQRGVGEVRVLGIGGPCLRCGADDLDFEVVVIDDVVRALVGTNAGATSFGREGFRAAGRPPDTEPADAL